MVLAPATYADAVCAYPGAVKVSQPDGTIVQVRVHGDENINWVTSTDGYTLMYDGKGFLTYAGEESGVLSPSGLRYRDGNSAQAAAMGFKPGMPPIGYLKKRAKKGNPPQESSPARVRTQIDGTFPSKGKRKLLMLLVNYKNTTPVFTQQDFDDYMNAEGFAGIGSFRDYYLENSYGQLDINTTVTRWITLPNEKDYYGSDGALALIADALHLVADEIDFRDFDNDGDGILDGLAVIHQGAGREATGAPNDIWSHSSTIYGMEFGGVQIRRYTIQPELLGNAGTRMSTIGVMCHEFGHNLGAPDFYDTDYELSGGEFPGTGVWDLMASGAWNGDMGDRPAGTNMWQKIQLGWVTPEVLDGDRSVKAMKGATFVPEAYRFDCTVPGEYFILENRQREGHFDSALPGEGLLIHHIDESIVDNGLVSNTVNATFPQGVYTVCAGSMQDPDTDAYTYGALSSDICPFPGAMGVTQFSDRTKPSTKSISGRYTYKGLGNIVQNDDGTVGFDFFCDEEPAAPRNLSAVSRRGAITLSWDVPEGQQSPVCYNLSRNGVFIGQVETCRYTDTATGGQTFLEYTVDAEYPDGLISPYESLAIRIPANRVASMEASVSDGCNVDLSWELDDRLTRMQGDNENFEMVSLPVKSLDYAHRFRAEDLAVYRGYKIRRIAFYPCQSQKELQSTLRIWESEPGAASPGAIVSERQLKEFGNSIWNNVTLTKQVEITGDKDLWIGVHYESSVNNITLLTDKGPVVDGFGNLLDIEGGGWGTDMRVTGNIFGYATLQKPAVAVDGAVVVPEGDADTEIDMYYPYAFAIYRDGELIGTTAGDSFTDTMVPEGEHVYSVSGLFKGGSESSWLEDRVVIESSGIVSAESCSPAIWVEEKTLHISGYNGRLRITSVDGVTLFSGNCLSDYAIQLPAGIYIVSTNGGVAKTIVR